MGRSDRDRKRARKQQAATQQPMMFMMPPMMQPQQQSNDESSSEDQEDVTRKTAASASAQQPNVPSPWDDAISSSCTFVKTVSRSRLSALVEALNNDLDACVTAPLSNHGLLALLYVFTRTKPISKISELRTLMYLFMKCSIS